jgi:hypothetical protein
VDLGSIPYSAVTQPFPEPISHLGTFESTEAVQTTCVSPNLTRQEPSEFLIKFGIISIFLKLRLSLLSFLIIKLEILNIVPIYVKKIIKYCSKYIGL